MARLFDDASTQYLYSNTPPLTVGPVSIACWFYTDTNATQGLVWIGDKDNDYDYFWLYVNYAAPNLRLFGVCRNSSPNIVQPSVTTNITLNQWHFAGMYARPATTVDGDARTFVLTELASNNAAGYYAPDNIDRLDIARLGRSTSGNYLSGAVAEVGIWNAALDGIEWQQLRSGIRPCYVRPQSLVAYYPLTDTLCADWRGTKDLTLSGASTLVPHPPTRSKLSPYVALHSTAAPAVLARTQVIWI